MNTNIARGFWAAAAGVALTAAAFTAPAGAATTADLLEAASRHDSPHASAAADYAENTLLSAMSALGSGWPSRGTYLVWFLSHAPFLGIRSAFSMSYDNRAPTVAALAAAALNDLFSKILLRIDLPSDNA